MAALTAAAILTAGASVFNAVRSATQKSAKMPQVPTLLTPPDPNDPALTADRNNALAKRKKASGVFSPPPTLLTGPNGLTSNAVVQQKTLLGS